MRLTLPKLTLPGRRLQVGASATTALVAAAARVERFGLQSGRARRFVVFESGSRSKQVDGTEFVECAFASPAMGGPPRIKAFKGEQAFTGAIPSVTQSSHSAVYFMNGQGE